ncbi:5-dehydro-2-deoxygluconokinase [Rothia sp. ZJ932]|uniref:5-dehydro-2-deoxygluconokinase n=1 Tax=Rothia sp. ZJ932 TaxID=2810516 RepID=UPI001967EDB2|nr:5-dehydro-2-deoxygluconokinase [Rothia sp. ZJ932]QRZ61487.1 5-dehydro-2-deoxygluconokinase [Rothia sp. ZJ932]
MIYELLTMGRISVDVYPNDIGVGLEDVNTFGKYLGGSPANVAVAAAKYGHKTSVITRVGDDPFGVYLRRELNRYGSDDKNVSVDPKLQTCVTFCAIKPPEDFPLYFYGRFPTAPDLQISKEDIDFDAVKNTKIFWTTLTGMCQEPAASAQIAAHEVRPREELADDQHTILDLDFRPMFWENPEDATEAAQELLKHATIAIGNREECAVAVGDGTPDEQAGRLLDAGVKIAVVKMGSKGVMAKTADGAVISAPTPVETANGLGAGDSFGGAFTHGILAGWPLEKVLDFANAAGAIVASQIACSEAMPIESEVKSFLAERGRAF